MTRHLHIDLRPNLNDQLVEAEWVQKEVGRHSPLSRFAPSLLRVSTVGGIAIAALTALYFIAEFLR